MEEARGAISPVRMPAAQALPRTAGAPPVPGNRLRLLKDARENLVHFHCPIGRFDPSDRLRKEYFGKLLS